MDIDADDDVLRKVAKDGSMNYSSWPTLLPGLVSRIEKIAHTEFPIPRIPPPKPAVRPPSPRFLAPLTSSDPIEPPDSSDTAPSSQETNKENANPSSSVSAAPNPIGTTLASDSPMLPLFQPPIEPGTLPPPIASLLDEITSVLTINFPQYPPHTIQRLSELVLHPKQHYRSLTAYLHAIDRVVHVTSGANTYPLPPAILDMNAMSVLANGVGANGQASLPMSSDVVNIGSDEALGGALLTPIPWLARRTNGDDDGTGSESEGSSPVSGQNTSQSDDQGQGTLAQSQQGSACSSQLGTGGRHLEGQVRTESTETIDGPNGMGSIETVSVSVNGIPSTGAGGGAAALVTRGITQGELLRQEQRAGVVPVSQLARHGLGAGVGTANPAGNGHGGAPPSVHPPAATVPVDATTDLSTEEDAPMTEEREVLHARGPEEIGAADMGPQKVTTSSFMVGDGVEMHGIDLERAVGRRPDHPTGAGQDGEQQRDDNPEVSVPRSPKREAEEEIDGGASKKLREDKGGQAEEPTASAGVREREDVAVPQKKDADGDVVLDDTDPGPGPEAKPAENVRGEEKTSG